MPGQGSDHETLLALFGMHPVSVGLRGREAIGTEAGKVFLETARRIITDLDNLQTTARAVGYGEQGRLAIGYCSSLMAGHVKAAFSDYLTRFPDVQFDGVCKAVQSAEGDDDIRAAAGWDAHRIGGGPEAEGWG